MRGNCMIWSGFKGGGEVKFKGGFEIKGARKRRELNFKKKQ